MPIFERVLRRAAGSYTELWSSGCGAAKRARRCDSPPLRAEPVITRRACSPDEPFRAPAFIWMGLGKVPSDVRNISGAESLRYLPAALQASAMAMELRTLARATDGHWSAGSQELWCRQKG
jgi:hypothetical protein